MVERRGRPGGILLLWGPVAIYVLLIFYASSLSNPPGIPPVPHFDKLVHFMEYGLLGFLLGRALGLRRRRKGYWAVFVASMALGACVGMADEYYQGTVAGREKSLADLLMDIAGLLGGLLLPRMWALRGRAASPEG